MNCLFCKIEIKPDQKKYSYYCERCGHVYLDEECAEDIDGERFKLYEKNIISIWIRNEYEKNRRNNFNKSLSIKELHQIVEQYRPLDPLDKIDNALSNIENQSVIVAQGITIKTDIDYPYYHCLNPKELVNILKLLHQQDLISVNDRSNPHNGLTITAKGYQRLRELKQPGKDSRLCFVAMWFRPEMNDVYENAIKPAIEFIEEGEREPRFRAVKIDNVEHVNDINDEIIATIRRSRFIVCDLTGYRGGVYFEAGFAYGLGLDIIYTCRKDWIKPEILKNADNEEIKVLYDSKEKVIEVKKEGVHFDIEHRNRIEWEEDKLPEFKDKLEKRIKAVII
jgi:hypothetical protein